MNETTKLIPNPVISAYIMSLKAAPTPVRNPYHRPLFSVRCTHRTPTGPIGADATIPIRIPFIIRSMVLTDSNHILWTNLAFLYDIRKLCFYFLV